IHAWDTLSGQELPGQPVRGGIGSMCVSPNGQQLAVSLWHGKRVAIFQWDQDRLVEVRTLAVHRDWVATVAYSPDGKYLASGTEGGFKLWNAATFEELRWVQMPATQLAFSLDSRILYAAWTNGPLRTYPNNPEAR